MCSSMRCYLWSVIVQEKKYAGHLFEFLMTLIEAFPFPKLLPYFLIKLEISVFDKILSLTVRKKCYVIWSRDFLWTILNNTIQSEQDTMYLCLAIHVRFKKVQKCNIYLWTTSCPPTCTQLSGHSSPWPMHLPSAPSGSAPSSCCQHAAVTTAGTTCHRARACSPCSDVHLPAAPCLRLSSQAVPPRGCAVWICAMSSLKANLPTSSPETHPATFRSHFNQESSKSIPSVRLLVQQLGLYTSGTKDHGRSAICLQIKVYKPQLKINSVTI